MDLIYADVIDGQIIDRGVLNTYTFDCSFGEKENDFELRAPMGAQRLYEDQIVYIDGTEYGGVIDAIEVDTETQMMVYTGRTWHGILENKVLYPQPGYNYFYVNGDANEVLEELLERMNIIPGDLNELYVQPSKAFISVADHLAGYAVDAKVSSESGNYAHGFTFIRDLLYAFNLKPQIINGVIEAIPLMDYSNDDDFLEGTDQFKAKRNYNSLNRLHCMGSGNLADRHTIDLYLDENGGLLPYSRQNPVQDSDYYTDIAALAESTDPEDIANFAIISEHMVTGINEIADIYDYPSIGSTYHYVRLDTQPVDWESDLTPEKALDDKTFGFEKYFVQTVKNGVENYEPIEKPDIDYRFVLQESQPSDWISKFENYYTSGANGFESVTPVALYDVVGSQPGDWYQGGYKNYFKLVGGEYTPIDQVAGLIPLTAQPGNWLTDWSVYALADGSRVPGVTPQPVATQVKKQPKDWASKYMNYYTYDGVNFNPVQGRTVNSYVLTTYQPSDWKTNWKNYYYYVGSTRYSLSNKTRPKWKQGKYYAKTTKTKTPTWDKKTTYYSLYQPPDEAPTFTVGMYYANGYVIPAFSDQTVYKKRTWPTWAVNTYYSAVQYQPIPEFVPDAFYQEFEDHYEALIEAALKKLEDYQKKDELSITLDERRIYDINDRVGASDEVTGIGAVERITQKVIKIERGIVKFSYKTGK